MSIKESIIVNSAIGSPVIAYGAFLAWYIALVFVVFTLVLIKQSAHN